MHLLWIELALPVFVSLVERGNLIISVYFFLSLRHGIQSLRFWQSFRGFYSNTLLSKEVFVKNISNFKGKKNFCRPFITNVAGRKPRQVFYCEFWKIYKKNLFTDQLLKVVYASFTLCFPTSYPGNAFYEISLDSSDMNLTRLLFEVLKKVIFVYLLLY